MDVNSEYRLSEKQKNEIAQNLIDILEKDSAIKDSTCIFILKWIRSDHTGKRKAFFDVWDIVLKNYLPETRPILFRVSRRFSKDGKIASFTGRFGCVERMRNGRDSLIICDTQESLQFIERYYKRGQYKHTFYPLAKVLQKAKDSDGWGFSQFFLNEYIGEDEYIMRVNLKRMHCLKWRKDED